MTAKLKKVVKNYFYGTLKECTMSACCNGLIWTMLDNLGNRYKSAKGYPCFTVGTGLMLTADVIKEKGGWPYKKTLTEDIELMYEAALDHRKFVYYEHAVLYMEEAQKLSVTNKRRRRWLTGVVQSERLYRKAVKNFPSQIFHQNRTVLLHTDHHTSLPAPRSRSLHTNNRNG